MFVPGQSYRMVWTDRWMGKPIKVVFLGYEDAQHAMFANSARYRPSMIKNPSYEVDVAAYKYKGQWVTGSGADPVKITRLASSKPKVGKSKPKGVTGPKKVVAKKTAGAKKMKTTKKTFKKTIKKAGRK
jgi:hypothetical protein